MQKSRSHPTIRSRLPEQLKRETGMRTGAVGMITSSNQAESILREDRADVIMMAREFLRQPYWPLNVAHAEGFPVSWPVQYLRAAPTGSPTREPLKSLKTQP